MIQTTKDADKAKTLLLQRVDDQNDRFVRNRHLALHHPLTRRPGFDEYRAALANRRVAEVSSSAQSTDGWPLCPNIKKLSERYYPKDTCPKDTCPKDTRPSDCCWRA